MTQIPDGAYSTDTLTGTAATRPTVTGTRIRVTFAGDRITGHAGCNTMAGRFEVADDRLACGPLAMTLMAGPEDVMAQERWLAQLLDASPAVLVDDASGTLVLDAGERRLDLRADIGVPSIPLVGTMWRLAEVRDAQGPTTVTAATLDRVRADVLLADTGSVMSVQTGCNLGQAVVTVRDETISVGPMRLTRRGCPPDAGPVERAVVTVLQGDVNYVLRQDRLELTRAGLTLAFRAEPAGTRVPPSTG